MSVLKFRVSIDVVAIIYRDIVIQQIQSFTDLHLSILQAYDFDNKHQATFYRSNENWQRGREISLEKYNKEYVVEPLLMKDTIIGSEIQNTAQRFVYVYDFEKEWTFLIELINVDKAVDSKQHYPFVARKEGVAPKQYTGNTMLGGDFADIEKKYGLKIDKPLRDNIFDAADEST